MDNRRNLLKKALAWIVCLLCAAALYGCGAAAPAKETLPTAPPATEVSAQTALSDAQKRVVPSPYHYFKVAHKYKEEVIESHNCTLGFYKYPALAVDDYCTLLTEEYGLVESDTGDLGVSLVELPHTVYFLDPETGDTCVKIYWTGREWPGSILCVEFSKDCRQEIREVWDGDITQYEFDQEDWDSKWKECELCHGSGKCKVCDGKGRTEEDILGFSHFEECDNCIRGKCPAPGCVGGRVRVRD